MTHRSDTSARRANFDRLLVALGSLEDRPVVPRALEGAEPVWFGFPITESALWAGCHQQLDAPQVDWISESSVAFFNAP